jgi:hypothetical protein
MFMVGLERQHLCVNATFDEDTMIHAWADRQTNSLPRRPIGATRIFEFPG